MDKTSEYNQRVELDYRVCHDGKGRRCDNRCTGWLVSPSGWMTPSCETHGEHVAREYRDKLNENWQFVAVETEPTNA